MEKPRPLDLEEIEKGLKFEIRDIESELREFKNDEMFFGKNGVDYHYKQELIDRRNEILKTLKLFDGIKQRIESAVEGFEKELKAGLLSKKEVQNASNDTLFVASSFVRYLVRKWFPEIERGDEE